MMATRTVPLRRRAASLLFLGLVIALAACSASSAGVAPVNGDGNGKPAADPGAGGTAAGGGNGTGSDANQALVDINQASLLVIKTGTMDLQVTGLDEALASASQKISALGGYVSGSARKGQDEQASADVTYRIPSARWDEALVAVRGVGVKVLGEQTQTQDVTGQVVDLSARITNLEATERALQAIILKADKISDVLAVQAQLTEVRGQIEQATAERKHLQEQAAFSTLTVNFSLKEQAVAVTTKQFDPNYEVDQASASLVGVLQGLATAGIWFGIVWLPILVGLGLIAAIVVFVFRRVVRAGPGGPSMRGPGGPGGGELAPAPAAEA
jgi:hypothetical protein